MIALAGVTVSSLASVLAAAVPSRIDNLAISGHVGTGPCGLTGSAELSSKGGLPGSSSLSTCSSRAARGKEGGEDHGNSSRAKTGVASLMGTCDSSTSGTVVADFGTTKVFAGFRLLWKTLLTIFATAGELNGLVDVERGLLLADDDIACSTSRATKTELGTSSLRLFVDGLVVICRNMFTL